MFRLRKDNTIFYLCSFLTYLATYILVMGWVLIIISSFWKEVEVQVNFWSDPWVLLEQDDVFKICFVNRNAQNE